MLDGTAVTAYPRQVRWAKNVLLYAAALVVLVVVLVPLSFSVLGGFRDNAQLVLDPVGLPNPWVFENYSSLLASGRFWGQLWNSTLIATMTTAFTLPAASLAAFMLARYTFPGRELIYAFFTLGLLFPIAMAILPLFVTLRDIGLLNTALGVAMPQAAFGLPISIVIMRPFFQSIPRELQDAATVDGCSPLRFYWNVMLPLSRPVLSTVAILTIVGSWNAFFLPLLILSDSAKHTLPIGVSNVSTQFSTDFSLVLAYTTLAMLPALLFYAIAERQIIGGLTKGAVKS
jgi:raffinose/stachyose/melibiose transport system permease protein